MDFDLLTGARKIVRIITCSWAWASGDNVSASAHVYRAVGPFIQLDVRSEDEDICIYLLPSAVFWFALGLIRLCCYAFVFKLKLIVRDYAAR